MQLDLYRRLSLVALLVLVAFFAASAVAVSTGEAPPEPSAEKQIYAGAFGSGLNGVWQVRHGNGTLQFERQQADSYTSVVKLSESRVLIGFAQGSPGSDTTGVRIVNWRTNETIWKYTFAVRTQRNSEVHDAEPLPNGNIVIADMDRERIFVVNRTTKAIEWQWHASEYYETPSQPATRTDWLHINDVDHLGDGRFLVSVRNTNQLLIVTRGEGVTEVINEDRSRETLYQQHNPQWLGGGRVLVADSENDRVVELARQPSGEWTVVWEATHANDIRFDWPRDADRLPNGRTLVTDTRNDRLVALDEDGEAVWSLDIPAQGYEADLGGHEYPAGPYYPERQTNRLRQPFHGIGYAYGAIRSQVPLPRWVGEWHLLVLVGVVTMIGSLETARWWSNRGESDEQ